MFFIVIIGFLPKCSLDDPPVRQIRGHTENYGSVAHGKSANKGARYCTKCHGSLLQGGSNGEFSCFKCHGQNWQDDSPEDRFAPADHTEIMGGIWYHHSSLTSVENTCGTANCHGTDLHGGANSDSPSCYLCHDSYW